LDRLAKWCETHIFEELLDENNALAIHKLFTTLGSSVAGRVEQYVKKTFPAIAQTEEFLKLSYEDVKKLLLATDLHTSSEQEVAPMNKERSRSAAVSLDNRLYVCGGRRGCNDLASVEVYDPVINHWTFAPSMTEPRSGAVAGVIDGYIYVVSIGRRLSAERFSTELQRWEHVDMRAAERTYYAVLVWNDKIYAFGEDTIDCFDPIEMRWRTIAMKEAYLFGSPLFVPHMNKIYIAVERRDGSRIIQNATNPRE
ncbi:kelch repeat protein, partial [Ancylostoma ceylanicum]